MLFGKNHPNPNTPKPPNPNQKHPQTTPITQQTKPYLYPQPHTPKNTGDKKMTHHHHENNDPEDFYTEVRKLEVRLKEYTEEEQTFVEHLQEAIAQLKELHEAAEKAPHAEETQKLKAQAIAALSEALQIQSKAEHEKSHLLESYGALMLALQEIHVH
jgi:hypothetical protein